jgi:hypothetical protein
MAEKRFIVSFKDGTTQPITAESGDEDEEADGYVFFIVSTGVIAGHSPKTSSSRGAKIPIALRGGWSRPAIPAAESVLGSHPRVGRGRDVGRPPPAQIPTCELSA